MKRAIDLVNVVDSVAEVAFSRRVAQARQRSVCTSCGMNVDPLKDFRDKDCAREWTFSYLCQKCQDEIFGI